MKVKYFNNTLKVELVALKNLAKLLMKLEELFFSPSKKGRKLFRL